MMTFTTQIPLWMVKYREVLQILYLLRLKERNPRVVEELHAVLPGKVTHVSDERRGEEHIPTESLLLLFILNNCLRPTLLL